MGVLEALGLKDRRPTTERGEARVETPAADPALNKVKEAFGWGPADRTARNGVALEARGGDAFVGGSVPRGVFHVAQDASAKQVTADRAREKRALRTITARFTHPADGGIRYQVEKQLGAYGDVHSDGPPDLSRRVALELLLRKYLATGEAPGLREELIQKLGFMGDSRSLALLRRLTTQGTDKERGLASDAIQQLERTHKVKSGARIERENPIFWQWYRKTLSWQRPLSDFMVQRALEGGPKDLERAFREHAQIAGDGEPVPTDQAWLAGPIDENAPLPERYNRGTIERLEQLQRGLRGAAPTPLSQRIDRVLADARAKNAFYDDELDGSPRQVRHFLNGKEEGFSLEQMNAVRGPAPLQIKATSLEWRYNVTQFEKALARENAQRAREGQPALSPRELAEAWRAFEMQDWWQLDSFVDWASQGRPFAPSSENDRLYGRLLRVNKIKPQETNDQGGVRHNNTAIRVQPGMVPPRAPPGQRQPWLYIIDRDGDPWIALEHDSLGHPTIIQRKDGSPVLSGRMGGQVDFDDRGRAVEVNNYSGRVGEYPDRTKDKTLNAALLLRERGIKVLKAVHYDLSIDQWHRPPGEVVFHEQ